jgi:hypothetical protein
MNGIWIRSQGKTKLVFVHRIAADDRRNEKTKIIIPYDKYNIVLGCYDYKRAIEVIDAIQQFIVDCYKCKDNVMFSPVFEMPQE